MNNRIPKVGLIKAQSASGNYYRMRYRLLNNKNCTCENIRYPLKYQVELIRSQKQT